MDTVKAVTDMCAWKQSLALWKQSLALWGAHIKRVIVV